MLMCSSFYHLTWVTVITPALSCTYPRSMVTQDETTRLTVSPIECSPSCVVYSLAPPPSPVGTVPKDPTVLGDGSCAPRFALSPLAPPCPQAPPMPKRHSPQWTCSFPGVPSGDLGQRGVHVDQGVDAQRWRVRGGRPVGAETFHWPASTFRQ